MSNWIEDWWIEEDKTISYQGIQLWYYSGKLFAQLDDFQQDSIEYNTLITKMRDIIHLGDTIAALKAIGGFEVLGLHDELSYMRDDIAQEHETNDRIVRNSTMITNCIGNVLHRNNKQKKEELDNLLQVGRE